MAEVAHVFVCPGHRLPMRELESAVGDREYWVARVRTCAGREQEADFDD